MPLLGTCIWLTSLAQLLHKRPRGHTCVARRHPPQKKQMKKKHVGATGPAMFPVRFHKLAYFLLAENERITCTSDLVSHDLVDVGGFL